MKIRTILPMAAAAVVMSVAGIASADTYAAASASEAASPQDRRDRDDDRRDRNRDRRERAVQSSSSTYGAGQVETSRDRSRATVVSGGQASGPGATSATSTVDAYGETTRDGSSADIFGGSTANANEPRAERRRRPN